MRIPVPITASCLLALLAACSGGGDSGGATGDPPPGGGSPPLIASFSPTSGGVGAEITVIGLNFGETPAANTVRFNGTVATVLSASATSLVAVVPAGATTGPIRIDTADGSATSSSDFTLLFGPGSAWTTRLAGPRGRPSGLAFTGMRFATVGTSPGFQASTNGLVWTVTSQLSSADDVAWDGSVLVAVGNSFWVHTSSDGLTWTMRSLPAGSSGDLVAVAPSGGAWVAVGEGGAAYSSPDGISWTSRDSGTTKDLRDVTWTGSRFLAVGSDGAVTTSHDGISWSLQSAPSTDSFTAVGASPSLAVATTFPYPGSQSTLLTTPDGIEWTPRVPGMFFNDVLFAAGRFVGVGFYASATSLDGIGWDTGGTVPGVPDAVVHTGTGYAAAGTDRNSAGAFFTSDDGLEWSMRAADHALIGIARRPSDGLLVTVGSDVARVSPDGGLTWSLHLLTANIFENYPFLDVAWSSSASEFVALVQVGANQDAYRSGDGTAWTRVGSVPCYGGLAASDSGLLVATGSSLIGNCIATSEDDGVTWTTRTPPAGGRINKAFWVGSQFVGVGTSGAIATSPDGVNWTPRTSGVTTLLRGVAASPSALVVVGDGGTILSSADGGISWTPRTSGTTFSLKRVAWTGSEFLAVGSTGRLLRSADGAAWATLPTPWTASPNAYDLNDIAVLPGGHLVAVGAGGLVATSP